MTRRIPGVAYPAFRPAFSVGVVGTDQVLLLTETQQFVLVGRAYRALAGLVDGSRTRDEIVAEASATVPFSEVLFALGQLEAKGHVIDAAAAAGPEAPAAWWDTLGVGLADAAIRIEQTAVAVKAVGQTSTEDLAHALSEAGIRVAQDDEAAILVVLTDDYLRPELAEIDRLQRESGRPWLMAKVVGSVVWLGPAVVPGQTACWHCLAPRLEGNRPVEQYVGRLGGLDGPLVTSRAAAAAPSGYGVGAVSTLIEQWVVSGAPPEVVAGRIQTHDLLSWEVADHTVVRRPQCTACGDPALSDTDRIPPPITLARVPKGFTGDGGHRTVPPQATHDRLKHHVSPITGVISVLERLSEPDADLVHAYNAGHNFAMITDDLFFLRKNLRGMSGGKGMTEIQARVSGMCEAVERWAGVWRGDEPTQRGTWADLSHEALHPRELLGFSERQYADRKEWNAGLSESRLHLVPEPLPDDLPIDWSWARSLTTGGLKRVPSAWAYFGHPELRRHFFTNCDSNGCSAGNTLEEAILQGMLELVERDATAIWWYNRLRRPCLDLESFGLDYIDRLRSHYDSINREFWALDLTTDVGIPVYAAISRRTDRRPEDILIGLGAHPDPMTAMLRAVTEMNQFLPAVAHSRPDGTTEYWFPDTDAHDWWRTATIESEPWVTPDPSVPPIRYSDVPNLATRDIGEDVKIGVERIARAGMDTYVIDQTRPDVELSVVRVVVPGLRHFWRRLGPGRLYDVPVAMGWLDAPNEESELNSWALFF